MPTPPQLSCRVLIAFVALSGAVAFAPAAAMGGVEDAIECPAETTFHERDAEQGRSAWCEDAQGRLHGPAGRWYANGTRQSRDNWVHGREHGRWLVWDENAVRREERYYVDGELNGVETSWYANGGKRSVSYFESGEQHGRLALWNESGEQIVEGRFLNGLKYDIWTIRGPAGNSDRTVYAVMIDDEDRTEAILDSPPTTCAQWRVETRLRRRGLLAVLALHSLRSVRDPSRDTAGDEFPVAVCIARESTLAVARIDEACDEAVSPFPELARKATVVLARGCVGGATSDD